MLPTIVGILFGLALFEIMLKATSLETTVALIFMLHFARLATDWTSIKK